VESSVSHVGYRGRERYPGAAPDPEGPRFTPRTRFLPRSAADSPGGGGLLNGCETSGYSLCLPSPYRNVRRAEEIEAIVGAIHVRCRFIEIGEELYVLREIVFGCLSRFTSQ
jgi:hypothetical protein